MIKDIFPVIVIFLAVFVVFLPSLGNDFVWDDIRNYIDNYNFRGLSPSNVFWMFTSLDCDNYYPLNWLTLAIDYKLWGMNPAGYHLTNVFIHALNAVVFFVLTKKIFDIVFLSACKDEITVCALVSSLLFALHPLRVESVAWISTRADLLCAFFYMLSVMSYINIRRYGSAGYSRAGHALPFFFFICSLLCRAWGVTLPAVLLVLDIFILRRINVGHKPVSSLKIILKEKLFFFLFAFLAAFLAYMAKESDMPSFANYGILKRAEQSAAGICFYLWKTIMPVNLSPLYLLDRYFLPSEHGDFLSFAAVLLVTVFALRYVFRIPWFTATWFCFIIILSPVLGIFQSGLQFAADRYTYISTMPLYILAGAGIAYLGIRKDISEKFRFLFKSLIRVSALILCVLAFMSFRQIYIWRDDNTLWSHAIRINPGNYVAYYNRGNFLRESGRAGEAVNDYDKAIKLFPNYYLAYYNRGKIKDEYGDQKGAETDFDKAIEIKPSFADAYWERARVENDDQKAIAFLDELIKLRPSDSTAYLNRALRKKGTNAIPDYDISIKLNPRNTTAYLDRGVTHLFAGDFVRALSDFNTGISLDPESYVAYYDRGILYERMEDFASAEKDFDIALKLANAHGNNPAVSSQIRERLENASALSHK